MNPNDTSKERRRSIARLIGGAVIAGASRAVVGTIVARLLDYLAQLIH
jgi:hypothetical protein